MNDIDFRKSQKVILTIEIEDKGQDFIELDVLENGVLLGNSMMFSHGRLSLLGIGDRDGSRYWTAAEVIQSKVNVMDVLLKGKTIYMKDTGEKDLLPWKAPTLKYPVVKIKKARGRNRFIKK